MANIPLVHNIAVFIWVFLIRYFLITTNDILRWN